MGAIRKTLSISTLGLVSWRSKKERLREAEEALEVTRQDLERTSKKETLLKERLLDAERRAEAVELDSLHDAKRARRRGARRARRDAGVSLTGKLDEAVEGTKRRSQSVRELAEARAAELQAKTAEARKKADKTARKATKRTRKKGGLTRAQLAAAAEEASATVRARAKELTNS